jgi:hypothetical protein
MNQPQIREVIRASVLLRHHMVRMEILVIVHVLVTDRTAPLLPLGRLSLAIYHGLGPRPPLSLVIP